MAGLDFPARGGPVALPRAWSKGFSPPACHHIQLWARLIHKSATSPALYLASRMAIIQHITNRGMIDRRSRGPSRPWDSQGRYTLLLNEPEQLHGPLTRMPQGWATKENLMTHSSFSVGIDVSKAPLDVALRPEGGARAVWDERRQRRRTGG